MKDTLAMLMNIITLIEKSLFFFLFLHWFEPAKENVIRDKGANQGVVEKYVLSRMKSYLTQTGTYYGKLNTALCISSST